MRADRRAASRIGASRARRELLQAGESYKDRLHLDILKGQVVVRQVERLTDDYSTLLAGLGRKQPLDFDLFGCVLVLDLIANREVVSLIKATAISLLLEIF